MEYPKIFNEAFEEVILIEGGYNNITGDGGGATNYGISLRFAKSLPDLEGDLDGNGHVDAKDILLLTPNKAKAFYYKYFWKHYKCDSIKCAATAKKVFSMYVNMRRKSAGRIIQRALRAQGYKLVEDGVVGRITKGMMNRCGSSLMAPMRSEQASHYRLIVAYDDTQVKFLNGWINRAYL